MKHVMIDLETLGTASNSVWLSLAAVQFDLASGKTGAEFYQNVQINDAIRHGLSVNGHTIKWWLEQNHLTLLKMFNDPKPMVEVLENFRAWWKTTGVTTPWGNSASFDLGILTHSYNVTGIAQPWHFTAERCYRTINAVFGDGSKLPNKEAHNPLSDCKAQIKRLSSIIKTLNRA